MMTQVAGYRKLFDIETARKETDSWRNVEYTVSNGAITITKGLYTWASVRVYLDNCVNGKSYMLSFKCSTDRETYPSCEIKIDKTTLNIGRGKYMKCAFECGNNTPILSLYFSNGNNETIPVTYYDFGLEET